MIICTETGKGHRKVALDKFASVNPDEFGDSADEDETNEEVKSVAERAYKVE